MTTGTVSLRSIDAKTACALGARVLWVVVRLVLVFWLGQKGAYFVYQGF